MVQKPITVARNDYMRAVCDITNNAGLPAFMVIDVLEKFISEMNRLAEAELSRDTAAYRQAVEREAQDVRRAESNAAMTAGNTNRTKGKPKNEENVIKKELKIPISGLQDAFEALESSEKKESSGEQESCDKETLFR